MCPSCTFLLKFLTCKVLRGDLLRALPVRSLDREREGLRERERDADRESERERDLESDLDRDRDRDRPCINIQTREETPTNTISTLCYDILDFGHLLCFHWDFGISYQHRSCSKHHIASVKKDS